MSKFPIFDYFYFSLHRPLVSTVARSSLLIEHITLGSALQTFSFSDLVSTFGNVDHHLLFCPVDRTHIYLFSLWRTLSTFTNVCSDLCLINNNFPLLEHCPQGDWNSFPKLLPWIYIIQETTLISLYNMSKRNHELGLHYAWCSGFWYVSKPPITLIITRRPKGTSDVFFFWSWKTSHLFPLHDPASTIEDLMYQIQYNSWAIVTRDQFWQTSQTNIHCADWRIL